MPDVQDQFESSHLTKIKATIFVIDDELAIRRSLQELFYLKAGKCGCLMMGLHF